jgi:hypothetical protein
MRPEDYRRYVTSGWSVRQSLLFGRQPAPAEVERWAAEIDSRNGVRMQVAAKGIVPSCD